MWRLMAVLTMLAGSIAMAQDFELQLRSQHAIEGTPGAFGRRIDPATWQPGKTAVIVCDVWDKHHSLNAVRRLEEFVPRLNELIAEARQRGAVIIHAPSDCMPAYEQHAARQRAMSVPAAANRPPQVEQWCSRIPSEELAAWPIDQSDGGDDDDPAEHATWAAELAALGRDPGLPWKSQHPAIVIDGERDYISDRGDEVWNILEHHGITSVILTGVHTNMCVLGRPFGLRRMVAGGRQVVLMRDLTDCMYNPARWPFVDHFTGNDLVVSHVERYVCPTVTSDQILGGSAFRFSADRRTQRDTMDVNSSAPDAESLSEFWNTVTLPTTWSAATAGAIPSRSGVTWYRCTLRLNAGPPASDAAAETGLCVAVVPPAKGTVQAWLNGAELKGTQGLCLACLDPEPIRFKLPQSAVQWNEANLFVLRVDAQSNDKSLLKPPSLTSAGLTSQGRLRDAPNRDGSAAEQPASAGQAAVEPKSALAGRELAGRWQIRIDDQPDYRNMPLPAKFGTSTDVVFEQ